MDDNDVDVEKPFGDVLHDVGQDLSKAPFALEVELVAADAERAL